MINYRLYTVYVAVILSFITAMLVSSSLEQAFMLTGLVVMAFLLRRYNGSLMNIKRYEFTFNGAEDKYAGITSVTILADSEEDARSYLQKHQSESLDLLAEHPLNKGIIHITWGR